MLYTLGVLDLIKGRVLRVCHRVSQPSSPEEISSRYMFRKSLGFGLGFRGTLGYTGYTLRILGLGEAYMITNSVF